MIISITNTYFMESHELHRFIILSICSLLLWNCHKTKLQKKTWTSIDKNWVNMDTSSIFLSECKKTRTQHASIHTWLYLQLYTNYQVISQTNWQLLWQRITWIDKTDMDPDCTNNKYFMPISALNRKMYKNKIILL